jgi:hypothetical protein
VIRASYGRGHVKEAEGVASSLRKRVDAEGRIVDGEGVALLFEVAENSGFGRFDLLRRLIGFDGAEDVAGGDARAVGFVPLGEDRLFWHVDIVRKLGCGECGNWGRGGVRWRGDWAFVRRCV